MKEIRVTVTNEAAALKISHALVCEKISFNCEAGPEDGAVFILSPDGLRFLQQNDLDDNAIVSWIPDGAAIEVSYTNWKGSTRVRKIIPQGVKFGESPYHPGKQWLLVALDPEDGQVKDFSLNTCVFDLSRLHGQ